MKHLVYLIDGTWLFAGRLTYENTPSNIYKLNNALNYKSEDSSPQIAHYVRGLGSTRGLRKYSSGGFAFAIDETIQDIYLNICSNYEIGDKIYIFGFSRGAVIARAICGMLNFGILKPEKINYIDDVWNAFIFDSNLSKSVQPRVKDKAQFERLSAIYKHRLEDQPKVEFLGLFDTVIGGKGMTSKLQSLNILSGIVPWCVKSTLQIHSLDESRDFFMPEPFKYSNLSADSPQYFEQIWLPGVHGDIGGGYDNNALSGIAQLIMIDRAIFCTDLSFKVDDLEAKFFESGNINVIIHDEFSHSYWKYFRMFANNRDVTVGKNRIHPVVYELSNINVTYKGSIPQKYKTDSISNVSQSEYFISPKFAGRSIKW